MKKSVSIILCIIFAFSSMCVGANAIDVDDPSTWTTQQIVEYYKLAASISNNMSKGVLSDVTVDSDGMTALIKNTFSYMSGMAEYYDGITGKHEDLSDSDLSGASARREGNFIVIDLRAKDQTYNYSDDSKDGSVTRLVGTKEFEFICESMGFDVVSAENECTNAYAENVKINISTGEIESGKWGFEMGSVTTFKMAGITFKDVAVNSKYTVEYPFTPTTVNSVDFPEEVNVRYKDTANISPKVDATSDNYTVAYTSSDYNVASVDSEGNIETYGRGTAVITCTVEGEGGNMIIKDCKVNVSYSFVQWLIVIFLFGWLWY